MITYVKGDLFQSPAQVLVNAVNTVGVMGKGIALEFKQFFPEMYRQYRQLCEQKKFQIGNLWLYKTPNKWILNFPTKTHWRYPSRLEYIEAGLQTFVKVYSDWGIHSIAFPPIGCGNGQLDFATQVQPLMHRYLQQLPIEVFVYPERKSEFVEHLAPKDMKAWLRSEPTSLAFSEVWDDIKRLLQDRRRFTTLGMENDFAAEIIHEPPQLRIIASGRHYLIDYEMLVNFWQQLRDHGFTMHLTVSELSEQMSYLTAIFAGLDYVTPVHLTNQYDHLVHHSMTGLQILPSAFQRGGNGSQLQQLSLL